MTALFERRTVSMTVDGNEFTVRGLRMRDSVTLLKIVGTAMQYTGNSLSAMAGGQMSPDAVGIMIVAAIPYAEDEIYELCGSLMGISAEQFADDMPPDTILELAEALAAHPDTERFFVRFSELLREDSLIRKLSRKLSMQFKVATDGATNTY